MLKTLKNFVLLKNVFGWKAADKIHPPLNQLVRIYGLDRPAHYRYFRDKIPNHAAPHSEQRGFYCFEFEDKSILYAKGLYWKEYK